MASRPDPRATLDAALATRRIVVVAGSGGVGKTTAAAALAMRAARAGRRVLVCTIDPSRRLATSLGLDSLSGRPRAIDLRRLAPAPAAGGALWAMVLDVKSTFDELVTRYTPDEAARERILEQPLLPAHLGRARGQPRVHGDGEAARAVGGDALRPDRARHAADQPRARLPRGAGPPVGFLDASILRWFLRPYFAAGRLTLKVATRTGAMALRLADRFLGLQFLADLSEFFLAFESMYEGFKERGPRSCTPCCAIPRRASCSWPRPSPLALEEALYFHRRLAEKQMPFVAFVVNRVHLDPAREAGARRRRPRTRPAAARAVAGGDAARAAGARRRRAARDRAAGGRHTRAAGAGARARAGHPRRARARRVRRADLRGHAREPPGGPGGRRVSTRLILYSGKGGVGKTSLSAATAIRAGRSSASRRWSSPPTPPTASATRSTGRSAASRRTCCRTCRRSRWTSIASWPATGARSTST